jgi:hypothetical protein
MLDEMTLPELGGWLALHRISPWGETRKDLRAGIVASVLANVNRDSKKRPKPYRPADFMPYLDEEKPAPSTADLEKRLLAAFGVKLDPKKLKKKRQ